jgi:polyhydroxybutyrate depolymerase
MPRRRPRIILLLLVASALSGCLSDVASSESAAPDGQSDAGTPDAFGLDSGILDDGTPTDASASVDASFDASVDASSDALVDASSDASADAALDASFDPVAPTEIGPPSRRARLVAPDAHDGRKRLPALFMLHGFRGDAASQDAYFRMSAVTRARGLYLVAPNGTTNREGARFWNATDACCDFDRSGVDDVAYLTGLLDELARVVPVDAKRVYFVGHSNGGFMSYRMACERASRIAAVASLAGSDFIDPAACVPAKPVSVLQIHGTRDGTINYGGGAIDGLGRYPGAEDVVARWASRASCAGAPPEALPNRDIDGFFPGAEAEVRRRARGCANDTVFELWRIPNGGHVPTLAREFASQVVDWLLARSR